MLSLRRSAALRRHAAYCKSFATQHQAAQLDGEYTEKPIYPEIKDLSFKAIKTSVAEQWHEQIKDVSTVEEKLIKINMPRYYGYKVIKLGDDNLPYNCLPAVQHYTRTVFEDVQAEAPAASKQEQTQQLDAFVQLSKDDVKSALEYAHDYFKHKYGNDTQLDPQQREKAFAQLVVEQVNRVLINSLVADCQHLSDVEIDYNPRHEAFWAVGGIDPPKNVVKSKKGREWQKEMANDKIDRLMQYVGTPYLAVRHQNQLPTWKSEAEVENIALAKEIPRYNYDPRTLGYTTEHRHGTNIPGYWPGSNSSFGCISFQSRPHYQIESASYGAADVKEARHAHAIQTSFAWLLAQANYNGFNTYSDLTYPMNTQTIITNGRDWSFYEYQLNTLLLHSRHVDENTRVNFCRGTDELRLYQDIDDKGKCIGFNEQVLRHLITCYINAPTVQRSIAELQPYLHAEVKRIADYDNVEQREFLERIFKHMTSNRPRHLAQPEIFLWEKIYKIDHKTRPLEARRLFYELNINPWQRTLDQHQKEYIPRPCRPEGTKSRKKFKKMYYP